MATNALTIATPPTSQNVANPRKASTESNLSGAGVSFVAGTADWTNSLLYFFLSTK